MSTLSGDPRRLRARFPGSAWAVVIAIAVLAVAYLARQIILPFLLALFLTYLLMPLVEAMTQRAPKGRRTPRALAVFLALAAFLGLLALVIAVLAPILASEGNRLARALFGSGGNEPQIARRIANTFQFWRDQLYGTGFVPPEVARQLDMQADNLVRSFGDAVSAALRASLLFFPRLLELIAVPLLTFYMLLDGPRLAREVRAFLPPAHQAGAQELMSRLDRVLSEYVRGQLLTSLFIGVVATVGLFMMGLKVALLVGVVALFVEAIPFFGPLIWGSLAVLLALAQAPAGSPLPLLVTAFAIVAQQIDSHVVAPLILGRFCRVHPLLLIFSTLLGASLFGIIGMFLAAPVTALAKVTFLFVMEGVNAKRETPTLRLSA